MKGDPYMFSEKEQAYLKALAVSAIQVQQKVDSDKMNPAEINDLFTEVLEDYLAHNPLNELSD
jgi:hypothetical protein